MYLKDRKRVLKKIMAYSLKEYDCRKISKTNHYFVLLSKDGLRFAPVKTIMTDDQSALSDANGTEAFLAAKNLGFFEVKGRIADNLRAELNKHFPDIKVTKDFKVLTSWDDENILKQVGAYAMAEKELKHNFIISGNKPLQGELGEWIFQKLFHANPLKINAKGADFEFKSKGITLRVEVKTKRPSDTNPAVVEVKGSKIHGEKKSDYLFIVWFKENYRIKHISFIPTAEIVKKMGTCQSYEVDPTNYVHCLAASYEALEQVSWKKYLYDHSFIKNWFSKKEML